jgi:hypothetical protein
MTNSNNEGDFVCEIVGLYPVTITPEALQDKIDRNPGYTSLSFDYLLSLFESLYLFELTVSEAGKIQSFINHITQETGEDQAPYLEAYLDDKGTRQIDQPDEAAGYPCRLCFYLHFVDLGVPLDVAGRHLPLPEPVTMPKRLSALLDYTPPN